MEDYNGWTNRETWATNLWIENDRGLYEFAIGYAKEELQEHIKDEKNDNAIYCLADILENCITEDLLNLENIKGNQALFNMLTDIGSLYRVNWKEIAEHQIASVLESEALN